jgi:hypothetical protein
MAENFRSQILNNKEAASIQTPVRTLGSVTFMYLRHNDLYVLMVTRNNAPAMMAFQFMTSVRGGGVTGGGVGWAGGAVVEVGSRQRSGVAAGLVQLPSVPLPTAA